MSMPSQHSHLHTYHRVTSGEKNDSLTLIANQIEGHQAVLDLGMGTGSLGQYLHQRNPQTHIDGVSINPVEAEIAAPHYRQIVIADLDTANLSQVLSGKQYDVIVCADVIEHLKSPEHVLLQCKSLLKLGGKLLTSVPNLGYCGLLAELIQGDFRYRNEGLLDETHLRFFTRKSLERFFTQNGWFSSAIETAQRNLLESEFKVAFDQLPPAVARHLLALPDAHTYQFISTLSLEKELTALSDTSATPGRGQALFSSQVYLAVDGIYSESNKIVQGGKIGVSEQCIQFDIPPSAKPYTNIRLDVADRPGFMRLHSLRILDAKNQSLWSWEASHDAIAALETLPHEQILFAPQWTLLSGSSMVLLGDDPWIEITLPTLVMQELSREGGQLVYEADWPMSADYLQAAQSIQSLSQSHTQIQSSLQAHIDRLQETLDHEKASFASSQQNLTEHIQAIQQNKTELHRNIFEIQQRNKRLELRLHSAEQYIQRIEESKLFRMTRPLAHLKYRLDQMRRRQPPGLTDTTMNADTHALPKPATPIDVIVPVYKGLGDTQKCILSALASANQTAWRLIIINDCSPEPEITQWLREIAQTDTRITLLENTENLGFVATVNKGMSLNPTHDVLLLNSDTEVANDWLDRIQNAAYAQEHVASVTPFSNNATICSYPRFCEGNHLPQGWDTASLDKLCAEHLAGQSVVVPTGVGFCMYIRRACLDAIGLFDVENFGKGYGEENDFCVRAEHAGWVNLHALDTFVHHSGGISFGDSKSERELKAMETIRRLHPHYERDVHTFVQKDPARHARLLLDLARLTASDRPTILNVMHNREGGTLRHMHELSHTFAKEAHFLLLTPTSNGVRLQFCGHEEALQLTFDFNLHGEWSRLIELLQQVRTCHIHYHHLLGHRLEVHDLHTILGVSHDFTAHDYYSYCPQISLTDANDKYCGEKGLAQCQQCVQDRPVPLNLTLAEWRERSRYLLQTSRHVLAPSADTAIRIQRFAPLANVKVAYHSQLNDRPFIALQPTPARLPAGTPLKVVVIGGMSKMKGADILEEVARLAAKTNASVEFHLIGYGYRNLKTLPQTRLTVHGAYAEKDLPAMLDWIAPHMAWFPAQCPETFSYTLSACLERNLPIMASHIGAMTERLAGRDWSWLIDWQSTPQTWLNALLNCREELAAGIQSSPGLPSQALTLPLFNYKASYLTGLTPPPVVSLSLPELADRVFLKMTHANPTTRNTPLRFAYWLRSLPLLSGIVKLIPSHIQRKVKTRLLT